ncbi:hypothetical protein SAMN03080594_102247 [Arenibacter palladensis]|uniref:Uncharacterized protein n=1 Tax=Arenibacter palladensis TaxID=237373 RepID=A0A1M4XYP1_9FLAO|nr:hypothetical protein SAMN03080594_102247 [Arenibacter palladensis]
MEFLLKKSSTVVMDIGVFKNLSKNCINIPGFKNQHHKYLEFINTKTQ